ncbi:(2Fe-2S)-binding protein [Roseateles sp. P5_E11]
MRTESFPPAVDPGVAGNADDRTSVCLSINGRAYTLTVPASTTLLDLLRDHLGLAGTKKGCSMGACGACTVLADGRRINACLTLAAMQDGREITTIEGVARDGLTHPLQQAFIDCDALQCGYCTPGQIVSALGLLQEDGVTDRGSVEASMSGNLCRCGAYPNIVDAILQVVGQR